MSSSPTDHPVTESQVAAAYQKLKTPMMGVIFSVALPFILWAAKSDMERGVGVRGRHQGLQMLARDNAELLPIAVVVGAIGAILCIIWFVKTLKKAQALKAQLTDA